MLRIIWKQLLNRKKKNVWIALELLLIFCLVWYMVDYFFVLGYNRSLASHRDTENTYRIYLGNLSETHAEYSEEESDPDTEIENFRRIVNRIKEHPAIESVALCGRTSSFPGDGGGYNSEYRNPLDTNLIAQTHINFLIPEEDYLKTFRHTRDKGIPVSMSDYNWADPENVLITRMTEERLFPGESAVGKWVEGDYYRADPPYTHYRVVGILDDIKRFNYLRPYGAMFRSERLDESNYKRVQIGIRTREAIRPAQFIATFKKDMSRSLRIGNYYLKNIRSTPAMEKEINYRFGMTNAVRTRTALMVFFLLNITLCVLGAFWYRVNARREEIGIRRAMGSDAAGIRRLFRWEGLLLLTIVCPLAMLIEIQFVYAGLIDTLGADRMSYGRYLPDRIVLRFLLTNAITWLLMASMIILAIWYPARTAAKIHPVDALRDE